ncbi:3-deoxy-8-phosphooctulonate synthase [bacterium]|nr:3-deoxy-8-phosphooctulonate synthase [bacterium]
MRIIAGPCQHESLEQSLEIAGHCKEVCDKYEFEYIFKASFDKANRTHVSGIRGRGLNATLASFLNMKEEIPQLRTLTDVHSVEDIWELVDHFNDAVDVLQIPAFLCRQTDIIEAACETDKIVNIKKGQFLAPGDVKGILSKCASAKEVWITERGTSFGYNNLVVDFNGMQYMLSNLGVPIVFDATHSCQRPGVRGNSSGGNRDYVPGLTRAASALGVSNFFLEVHADPDNAPSDGPNMLRLEDFERTVNDIDRYSYTG